jgi:cytochrome c oxidase cbb3-type subunit 4
VNKDWLRHFSDTDLAVVGMLIFLIFFVGVFLWTFRKSAGQIYDKLSKIPLEESEDLHAK